ncbi:MAG: hypothetical protein WAX69_09280 [Victivallales bacterium]
MSGAGAWAALVAKPGVASGERTKQQQCMSAYETQANDKQMHELRYAGRRMSQNQDGLRGVFPRSP